MTSDPDTDADPGQPGLLDGFVERANRREIIALLAGMGIGAGAGQAGATADDGDTGQLHAGRAALSQAYKFAEGPDGAIWIGPDSAKSTVSPSTGNVYLSLDSGNVVMYRGDGSSWSKPGWGKPNDPLPAVHTDQAQVNQEAFIDTDESVIGDLEFNTQKSVTASDGTHYITRNDSGEGVLYKADDTRDALRGNFTEVNRFSDSGGGVLGLGITSAGTILMGINGNIKRSTDDGSTFTNVQSLSGTNGGVWNFSINSDDVIIAAEYGSGPRVWKSTDDGASWTAIGDGTDFDFPNHCHQAKFHPADKTRILVSGGDGIDYMYISNDTGTSWTKITTPEQIVGVMGHPTDASIILLGTDSATSTAHQGVWRMTYSGGSSFDTETPVLWTDLERKASGGTAAGTFDIFAVNHSSRPYYVTASYNQDTNILYASRSLDGRHWAPIGRVTDAISLVQTAGQYGSNVDPSYANFLPVDDRFVNIDNLAAYRRGVFSAVPVDQRVTGEIHSIANAFGLRMEDGTDTAKWPWVTKFPNDTNAAIQVVNGELRFWDRGTNDIMARFDLDADEFKLDYPMYMNSPTEGFGSKFKQDLTSHNGSFDGEILRSDGTSGVDGEYYRWDDANTQWVRVGDETETI